MKYNWLRAIWPRSNQIVSRAKSFLLCVWNLYLHSCYAQFWGACGQTSYLFSQDAGETLAKKHHTRNSLLSLVSLSAKLVLNEETAWDSGRMQVKWRDQGGVSDSLFRAFFCHCIRRRGRSNEEICRALFTHILVSFHGIVQCPPYIFQLIFNLFQDYVVSATLYCGYSLHSAPSACSHMHGTRCFGQLW